MCSEKLVAKMKKCVFWVAKIATLAGDALRGRLKCGICLMKVIGHVNTCHFSLSFLVKNFYSVIYLGRTSNGLWQLKCM